MKFVREHLRCRDMRFVSASVLDSKFFITSGELSLEVEFPHETFVHSGDRRAFGRVVEGTSGHLDEIGTAGKSLEPFVLDRSSSVEVDSRP